MEDIIYEIFGSFLNGELQKYFYNQERELLFYRCNESENRDETCCGKLHGTVCITSVKNVSDFAKKSISDCGNIKEEINSNLNALITINLYSGKDEVMGIAQKLGASLRLSRISDFFGNNAVSVKRVKSVRRLDQIVKERFEYRANLDLEVNLCGEVVSDIVCRLKGVNIDLLVCNKVSRYTINSDRGDCKKAP